MKAVIFNSEQAVPVISEWPSPLTGPNEVVIRVHAAALNHRDLNITRAGNPAFVYGSDVSGIIEHIGDNVTNLQVGDEVIVNTYITCGHCEHCMSGNESLCEQAHVLGGQAWPGTFAEFVKVPAVNVVKKPEHLNFEHAAALPMAFGTAWRALMSQANLKPGETLLVQGIGGGVALAAMQIALSIGARVIVTSGSHEKLKKAVELGASDGINYKTEDVVARVKELTDGKGVHASISSGGADSIATAIEAATLGGRIVQYAYLGAPLSTFDIDTLMFKQLRLMGSDLSGPEEFADAINFVAVNKIVPVVSDVVPFDNALHAFQQMRESLQFGKIVIKIQE